MPFYSVTARRIVLNFRYLGEVKAADKAAIAAQALAELRLCRKPFETERWAYHWGPKLCQMLGAE